MSKTEPRTAILGNQKNSWVYDSRTGFDLTHRDEPTSPMIKDAVTIETAETAVTIDPGKSALIIIDMQNYFLSATLGRSKGKGTDAMKHLVEEAIPAARKASIRVIWLNWGLDEQELNDMPPGLLRMFGFAAASNGVQVSADRHGKPRTGHTGLGSQLGKRTDEDSKLEIEAGRVLMRGEWNSELHPPLDRIFAEGKSLEKRPDVLINKNRLSGLWSETTAFEQFLSEQGIKTLLFAGVNTDQCVGTTLQDAHSKGYDCILLSDGSGTASPQFAQESTEFNAVSTWGFATTCALLAKGVEDLNADSRQV